jgi:hypothetical protein
MPRGLRGTNCHGRDECATRYLYDGDKEEGGEGYDEDGSAWEEMEHAREW